jgi:hypothetical protein
VAISGESIGVQIFPLHTTGSNETAAAPVANQYLLMCFAPISEFYHESVALDMEKDPAGNKRLFMTF